MAHLNIREWALKGAEQRLVEIAAEAAAIYRAFPELRDRENTDVSNAAADVSNAAAPTPTRKRRRFRMSAEAKARIAEAQRKRWVVWKANRGGIAAKPPTRKKR
jgi:hypothetical protein